MDPLQRVGLPNYRRNAAASRELHEPSEMRRTVHRRADQNAPMQVENTQIELDHRSRNSSGNYYATRITKQRNQRGEYAPADDIRRRVKRSACSSSDLVGQIITRSKHHLLGACLAHYLLLAFTGQRNDPRTPRSGKLNER